MMIFEPIGKEAQNERARQKVMFCLRCQCHQQVMFPFNKHHKQSICWFALCRHCPDRDHSPVFHVLVQNMTLSFDVNRTRHLWRWLYFHFQNSSNMKEHEKQKKRDVTTRKKNWSFKNKMGHHASQRQKQKGNSGWYLKQWLIFWNYL